LSYSTLLTPLFLFLLPSFALFLFSLHSSPPTGRACVSGIR